MFSLVFSNHRPWRLVLTQALLLPAPVEWIEHSASKARLASRALLRYITASIRDCPWALARITRSTSAIPRWRTFAIRPGT